MTLALLLAAIATATPAATAAATPLPQSLQPIAVQALHFEFAKDGSGLFSGNVIAKQGDVTLRAAEVVAHYSPKEKVIADAVADGGVTVTSQKKVVQSDKAVFDNAARTIVLTGEPRVWEDGSLLEGERVVFHVDDGNVQCFSCSLTFDPAKAKEMQDELKKSGTD